MSEQPLPSPLFPLPAQAGLSLDDLRQLYALADWGVVLLHPLAKYAYGNYSPDSMFRALALPFLISIPAERALAKELQERENLRSLCGFGAQPPTRAMFWHFRHSRESFFPTLMLHVLIQIAIAGYRLELRLPFIRPESHDAEYDEEAYKFVLNDFIGTHVRVWSNQSVQKQMETLSLSGKTTIEALQAVKDYETVLRQHRRLESNYGLAAKLDLPVKVRLTWRNTNSSYDFVITLPDWLEPDYNYMLYGVDTITGVDSSATEIYNACNLLVVRESGSAVKRILLAQRLNGFGKGKYGMPGGKQRPGESLLECARRELLEETQLRLLDSKPISVKQTHFPNMRPAWSIGVLVTRFSGQVARREENQHSEWAWYSLDNLPSPIFEPAQLVISDYIQQRFDNLSWNDLEKQISHTGEIVVQQPLFPD